MSSLELVELLLLVTGVTSAAAALGVNVVVSASPVVPESPPSPYGFAMQPPAPSSVMSLGQTHLLVFLSLVIGAVHVEDDVELTAFAPP